MKSSDAVRSTMLRFYERLTASDIEGFDALVSDDAATLVIGTAPGEWVNDRAGLRFGFETEGVGITAGPDSAGFEERSVGWFVDQPTMSYPDGSTIQTRLTAVLHRAQGAWRLIHMHVSVGVPDDEVVTLQRRWSPAS
jgi:ketosteroid isomerase-like protein